MGAGRPKKPITEKIKNGTHRVDRDGELPGTKKKLPATTKRGLVRASATLSNRKTKTVNKKKKTITKKIPTKKTIIQPPETLKERGKAEWLNYHKRLTENGHWGPDMATVIEMLCIEHDLYFKAVKDMADAEFTNFSQNGQPHPNTIMNNKLANINRIFSTYKLAEKLAIPIEKEVGKTEEEIKLDRVFG